MLHFKVASASLSRFNCPVYVCMVHVQYWLAYMFTCVPLFMIHPCYILCRFSRSDSQSIRVLSPRERTQLRWNGNPYLLDSVGSSNEMDPGPWLMSYWLAKWTRLL